MVRCKAHNLETVYACVGSIPTPATKVNICNSSGKKLTSIFVLVRIQQLPPLLMG